MATFWERTAHSVDRMFSLYCIYLYFKLFPVFGFEGKILVLIVPLPGHCLLFFYV